MHYFTIPSKHGCELLYKLQKLTIKCCSQITHGYQQYELETVPDFSGLHEAFWNTTAR